MDIVRTVTGLPRGWISLKGGSFEEETMSDLVQADIGSWSPLELTATCHFF